MDKPGTPTTTAIWMYSVGGDVVFGWIGGQMAGYEEFRSV